MNAARLFAVRFMVSGAVAMAAVAAIAPHVAGQGPGQPPKRIAPSLDAVLPKLNNSVVRVRTPSEAQLAGTDASLEAARDGVATTDLTGVRIREDLALVAIPGTGAMPTSFDVGLFGAWLPSPVVAADAERRLVVVRTSGRREPAPELAPARVKLPGFVVMAASKGATLDIRTVWLAPDEPVDVAAGGAVFGVDGRFYGLVHEKDGRRILLPGEGLLAHAEAMAKGK
jgi:hypothetical protein